MVRSLRSLYCICSLLNASVDMIGLLSRGDQCITDVGVWYCVDGTAAVGGSIDGESC